MLRPKADYIVVKPLIRKQSDIIEVISYEKHCRGEILAIGPGKEGKHGNIIPMQSEVGQIVIFGDGNFDFYPIYKEGNETYRIIQEADIAGVLEDVSHETMAVA
jgi:chaperonin GroES